MLFLVSPSPSYLTAVIRSSSCAIIIEHTLTYCAIATDMKERIQKFKEEKIGSRRRDFVETVKTVEGGDPDAMDTT